MAAEIAIDIKMDQRKIKRFLTQSQRKCLPKATRSALFKTMQGITKTDAPKVIQENLNITKKPLSKRLRFDKNGIKQLRGKLLARRDTLHLTDFKGTSQNKKGVGYKLTKGGQRKLLKSGFIMPGRNSNKKIVFRRVKGGEGLVGRYPIKARKGPSVGSQITKGKRTTRKIIQKGRERWAKQFTQRLDYELNVRKCGQ